VSGGRRRYFLILQVTPVKAMPTDSASGVLSPLVSTSALRISFRIRLLRISSAVIVPSPLASKDTLRTVLIAAGVFASL
jgi:hypothetical protein